MRSRELGRVLPPYGSKTNCQLNTCGRVLSEELGAYLFNDLRSGRLVLFCGACAIEIELHHSRDFMVVAL